MKISSAISTLFSKPLVFPLLTILVSVVAVSALFQPGIIVTHDGVYHLDRLIAFDQALREGDFYPRWFPEFATGYGYPVLNYYAPLSYYVGEFFHLLGFGLASSEKLTFGLSIVVSGLAMYVWIAEAFGSRRSGFLAAMAYVYFPYRMTDVYVRGALAECLAFVFPPLVLWSTYRLIIKNDRMHLLYGGVFLALLVLTHNISALFFVPLWLGYALWLILFGSRKNFWDIRSTTSKAFLVLGILVLGIALSAIYWLPALLEQGYASTNVFKDTGNVPINKIGTYSDLIQPGWFYDYDQYHIEVGLVQLIVCIAGVCAMIVMCFKKSKLAFPARQYVTHGLFFLAVSFVCVLMMSPAGIPAWSTVPLIDYIQFPWRLLGFVGLGTSVLAGLLASTRKSFFLVGLPAVAALAFFTMVGMPLLHTNLNEDDLTISGVARQEFNNTVIAGDASAEYLPALARINFVVPEVKLTEGNSGQVKPESSLDVVVKEASRNQYKLLVSSQSGGPFLLHQFFFPGWQARLDGKEISTYPSTPIALVTVDVPPGEHSLELFFGDTELRNIASKISAGALLLLMVIYIAFLRRQPKKIGISVPVFSIAAIAFYFSAGLPQNMQYVTDANLSSYSLRSQEFELGNLKLAGFSLDSRKANTERKIDVILYWQSLGKDIDSSAHLSIKNSAGEIVGSRLARPIYGANRTDLWKPDELVRDEISVPIEKSLDAGLYSLELSTETEQGIQGSVILGNFDLPRVTVVDNLPSIQPVDSTFDGKIELLGYTARVNGKELKGEKMPLAPGDTINLTLYWKSLKDMDVDYSVFVHLLDPKGNRFAQADTRPRAGFSNTSLWLKGDVKEDNYAFYLPENLPMGAYRLDIGLYYLKTMERLPIDGQTQNTLTLKDFKVVPKEQSKEAPVHTTNILLGDAMRLVGATVGNVSNGDLHMKLFWQADKEMDKDYTVFLHVLDSSGKVVAQVDRQPMNGSYPTSFWSPGENIVDNYDIILGDLPPGDYQLKSGAYFLPVMTNLTTSTGEANVDVGSFHIEQGR